MGGGKIEVRKEGEAKRERRGMEGRERREGWRGDERKERGRGEIQKRFVEPGYCVATVCKHAVLQPTHKVSLAHTLTLCRTNTAGRQMLSTVAMTTNHCCHGHKQP